MTHIKTSMSCIRKEYYNGNIFSLVSVTGVPNNSPQRGKGLKYIVSVCT